MSECARIGVVDDDEAISGVVSRYLTNAGFDVSVANSHQEFSELVNKASLDVVLLDLHLPDGHGLEIARELRSRSGQMGIIVVSGSEDSVDRVVALELGADDFIAKPFDSRELLARVRAVLRRVQDYAQTKGEGRVRFGEFELDLDTHELFNDAGETVHLTSHEFTLLKVLIQSANRVLNREQILQMVSGRDWFYSDRSVDVLVGKLRKKIEEDPSHPRFIRTIRGAGYKFTSAGSVPA